jgi:hypothetical protein
MTVLQVSSRSARRSSLPAPWHAASATSVNTPSTPSLSRRSRPTSLLRRRLPLEAITLVTVHAKMLRLELLKVKADLERELEDFSLNCSKCGLDVHWVSGLGVSPGHWAHREPAPHGEPSV